MVLRYKAKSKRSKSSMYIDPNTGGVLFQALLGVFAVLSGALFVFSRQIREWIARMRRRGRKEEEENQ